MIPWTLLTRHLFLDFGKVHSFEKVHDCSSHLLYCSDLFAPTLRPVFLTLHVPEYGSI